MQVWPVAHFFHFVITFGWMQQQSNSKPIQKWWQNEKKWATGQSCIHKDYHKILHDISNKSAVNKTNQGTGQDI